MLRKRRLDLGLRQVDVAKMLGCDEMSVVFWENGQRKPYVRSMGKIIQFLGYNPIPTGTTIGERLVAHRKSRGLTQKEFARQIGVNPCTLSRWELGERKPEGAFLKAVKVHFLK